MKPLYQIINEALYKITRGPRAIRALDSHIGSWTDKINAKIEREQKDIIKKKYGKKAGETTAYGFPWRAVDSTENERNVSYTSGVKGSRRSDGKILKSTVRYPSKKISHKWED